ncbi:hypothetical protein [Marinobacterium sedimentorum]|uniref:hypothetical protein n=1 Tax=Marinobacterium sedimentorum TaxID=2927804 RepID=UPI0020C699CA|nr:hypothetical protein [Marinobacterium sedimentorum]MCP8687722.1 hypothetical protein [Marinobacterium sedimentorum]
MADVLDQVDERETRINEMRIQAIRNAGRELHPIGECHWCNEPFDAGSPKLFCDATCSTDWGRRKR